VGSRHELRRAPRTRGGENDPGRLEITHFGLYFLFTDAGK
jgi:hypothetical protein